MKSPCIPPIGRAPSCQGLRLHDTSSHFLEAGPNTKHTTPFSQATPSHRTSTDHFTTPFHHRPYVSFPLHNKLFNSDSFLSPRTTSNQLPLYPRSKFRTATIPKFHDTNLSYVSSHLFISTCNNTYLSTPHHSNFLSCMCAVLVTFLEKGLDSLIDWGSGDVAFLPVRRANQRLVPPCGVLIEGKIY
jgi:hypothetical protein